MGGSVSLASDLKQQGNAAYKSGDFELAVVKFTEAIGADHSNHLLYSNRSAALLKLEYYRYVKYESMRFIFPVFFLFNAVT